MDELPVLTIVLALLMALAAAGGVLFIKLARRSRPSRDGVGEAVPARPMSSQQARRLQRNYLWSVIAVAALIACAVLWMAGGGLA